MHVDTDTGEVLDPQPPLIPLTDDEVRTAGRKLAALVKERETLVEFHAEIRAEQRKELAALDTQIAALAQQIRTQGR